MEPLSSFAISLAAGIALDFYNQSQGSVKIELQKAFKKALKLWCKNPFIRSKRRRALESKIRELLSNPERIADFQSQYAELTSFFKKYEEVIAQYSSAYNYLKEIKDLQRFREQILLLSEIKNTVEDTNKKFTEFIENNLPQINKILESEWKRQLEVYRENIYNLKPKTGLSLLVKLEESFITNETKPTNALLASIEFLKAQCYELLIQAKEMYKCYVKSYGLDAQTIQIMEKACYSYDKIGEREKSIGLIKKLLDTDEYNSTAWAMKIITDDGKNLEAHILETPPIVREDWNFKRLVYLNVLNKDDYEEQIKIFTKYDFLTESYNEEPITYSNYKKALYVIEIALSRLLKAPYIEFTRNETKDLESIKNTNKILSHFLQQMSESEILANYRTVEFCYYFTEFVLTEKRESVLKMKSLYQEIKKHDVSLLMMLANSLQLIGEEDDAISIINEQGIKFIETIHLEAFCYLKKSDIENYARVSKELLSSTKKIDFNSSESILSIPVLLYQNNRLDDVELSDFIDNKEIIPDSLGKLISSFIRVLKKESDNDDVINLQSIEDEIIKTNLSIKFYIPYSYFKLEKWELAISSFSKYVSREKESRDLYFYILALDKSLTRNKELLELLKIWRTKFSFNEDLLRIEADLCRQLPDWSRLLTITEYYLSKNTIDEPFLVLKLISINELELENKNKRIEELAELFKDFDFKFYGHVHNVSKVLIQNGFYKIALDIIYKKAIDSGNIQARMDYFFSTTQMPEGIIIEKDIVEVGSHVKYSIGQEVKFIHVQPENSLAEKLIGHKKGDTINMERPMVKNIDSIIILRIMDKYLCLHDEILEEVKTNPYSGFPMQSFEFKDTSPEGLNKAFIEIFGAEGTIQKQRQEDTFKKYYNFNLSFTELIIQIYNSDYLGGYYNLVSYKDGITQIPQVYYPKNISINDSEIVIDFSSLLILYQISREHNITFSNKFLITKGVVEYIRASLKKEKLEPKEKMSLNITHEKVTADKIPENASENNIVFLEKLIRWINSNCIETIVSSKLDVTRKLDGKLENEMYMNLIIENVSLVMEKESRIILTDDSIYFKFYPIQSGKTISSELYIKSNLPGNESCQLEFVKNKYIGHTYNSNILLQEFNKKLKDQPNYFAHCINSTALRLIPSEYTIFTVVSFLKQIAMNPIITSELFKQESVNALVNLLKGQREEKPFRITEQLLLKEFELLGAKLEIVLESYNTALHILGIN